MRIVAVSAFLFVNVLLAPAYALAENPVLVQGVLTEPGSTSFHLKAVVTDGREADPVGELEMDWVTATKWRRTIKSHDFSQTLIVNGEKVLDQHSDDYLPLGLQTLALTMVDPQQVLSAYQAGDRQITKANGSSFESGMVCYDAQRRMCSRGRYGMMESVEIAGHSVELMDYQNFEGKRIARRIIYTISVGDFQTAVVTELSPLKKLDEDLFAIPQPTPPEDQLKENYLSEKELRSLGTETPEIIWPQVLDGAETGDASFYISLDRNGRVREVLPIKTANERSNDSAIRQIMRWKFKPMVKNGTPAQVEGILTFSLNTRKYGPSNTLDDTQLRKLASNMVEPVVPREKAPPGSEYKLWIAVDSDGIVIEKIVAGGPSDIFGEVDHALKQWRFQPVLENGQPRPYRGLLIFKF